LSNLLSVPSIQSNNQPANQARSLQSKIKLSLSNTTIQQSTGKKTIFNQHKHLQGKQSELQSPWCTKQGQTHTVQTQKSTNFTFLLSPAITTVNL
jgi:hypothetical protein